MNFSNRGIHFKKLWHKVAVSYTLIIVILFFIFFFFFEKTLIRYFENEQIYQYEKALERFQIFMEDEEDYTELENRVKTDEFTRDYQIFVYGENNSLLMGNTEDTDLLLKRKSNIKTSRGVIVDRMEGSIEVDYWIFRSEIQNKGVYFVKNINELSDFYTKVIYLIAIFAVTLSLLFAILSIITSRWLLKPIFEILKNQNDIELDSQEELDINLYSEEELRRIIRLKNNFIIKVRDFINKEKRFVANASHEMLTPITVIRGYSEILRWSQKDDMVFTEALDVIEGETNNMEELMKSLLLLSKIDKSGEGIFEDINLKDVLSEEIKKLRKIYKREIKLSVEAVRVSGDANLICQSVKELIKNAIKYSGEAIIVEVLEDDTFGMIKVIDRGIGISEELRNNIFDRFSQGDASKSISGYGLGLSIVKEIVDIHRGEIYINSNLGKGTEITIKIPLNKK